MTAHTETAHNETALQETALQETAIHETAIHETAIHETDRQGGARLSAEQALAKRWLRSRRTPLEAWRWLAGANCPAVNESDLVTPPELRRLFSALGEPLAGRSSAGDRTALASDFSHMAALFLWVHRSSRGPSAACLQRMLAASMLPLYRALADDSSDEVILVMRRQLADALALATLLVEFQLELPEILAKGLAQEKTPYELLDKTLTIDLKQLSERMLTASHAWSGADDAELHICVCREIHSDGRPAWAAPEILWRLAGELVANRSEFVVPRDWVQTPVPWNDASQHWRQIIAALVRSDGLLESAAAPVASVRSSDPSGSPNNSSQNCSSQNSSSQNSSPPDSSSERASELDDVARLKLEIEIADSVDALVQSSRTAARDQGSTGPWQTLRDGAGQAEFVLPKTIIAEIRSHNDPAFVAVIRRQLTLCRNDDRAVSLVAARVQAEAECQTDHDCPDSAALQSLGLASWQQKLVNWMSEHPEVNEPYAFISGSGELILCLMDVERNTATLLLRQGLIRVLTGQSIDGDPSALLARVEIPARFHSGIASVSAPSACFEPEQLIEAAYRCLAAAQRHGKASIKSIEVF